MTSKIKVDNINKVSDDSNIINKCGSTTTVGSGAGNTIVVCGATVTIGRCGGSVALASGASQTGFGREGSVNWQTAIKTGDFTAASGEGYFIDTTSGAVTMTLPSSPSVGDIVAVKDYANTFDTHNLTINRNSQPISGSAVNPVISTEGQALTLVYGDSTKGWQSVAASTESDLPKPGFIEATGGTITTVCTNYKVHTFTGPGSFQVTNAGTALGSNEISYLVVAGGGAAQDAGGGAGGFREGRTPQCNTWTGSPLLCTSGSNNGLPVAVATYPVTVGGGAPQGPGNNAPGGRTGSNSVFAGTTTITSAGGGGGCTVCTGTPQPTYIRGGSGGGQRSQPAGAGNYPPVSPPQGQPSGNSPGPGSGAAGGGGATVAGGNWTGPRLGGTGATTTITGGPVAYAGGGSGAAPPEPSVARSPCGTGGAGISGAQPAPGTQCGVVNTGGGGGGVWSGTNGNGGSGIVVIRYKFQ